jgi:ribosome biogenesis protein SSF1/2
MARKRRKTRTHLKGVAAQDKFKTNVPKSFVIKNGLVGSSISSLVRDTGAYPGSVSSHLQIIWLSFHMERYSLMKDVVSTTRRAKRIGLEYLIPPLVSTFGYYFLLVVSRFVFIHYNSC